MLFDPIAIHMATRLADRRINDARRPRPRR